MEPNSNWDGLLNLVRGTTWQRTQKGFALEIHLTVERNEKDKPEMRLNLPGAKMPEAKGMNYPGANAEELFAKLSKDLKL